MNEFMHVAEIALPLLLQGLGTTAAIASLRRNGGGELDLISPLAAEADVGLFHTAVADLDRRLRNG